MPINKETVLNTNALDVVLVQLVSVDDWRVNIARVEHLVRQACEQYPADLIVLPENAMSFGARAQQQLARDPDEVLRTLAELAQRYGTYLVTGSVPLQTRDDGTATDGRLRSASLVFGPRGELCARYDKIHLFDVNVDDAQGGYRESETFEPGNTPRVFPVRNWLCGMSICYDLRFAELYRLLTEQGSELIIVPSAFTAVTGEAHWESLLRARAIENQCYVLAANQGGQHSPQRKTWGRSMVIDPWGRVIAQCGEGEHIVRARLERAVLEKVRSDMPVHSHRRLV